MSPAILVTTRGSPGFSGGSHGAKFRLRNGGRDCVRLCGTIICALTYIICGPPSRTTAEESHDGQSDGVGTRNGSGTMCLAFFPVLRAEAAAAAAVKQSYRLPASPQTIRTRDLTHTIAQRARPPLAKSRAHTRRTTKQDSLARMRSLVVILLVNDGLFLLDELMQAETRLRRGSLRVLWLW